MISIGKENRNRQCLSYKEPYGKRRGGGGQTKTGGGGGSEGSRKDWAESVWPGRERDRDNFFLTHITYSTQNPTLECFLQRLEYFLHGRKPFHDARSRFAFCERTDTDLEWAALHWLFVAGERM